MGSAPQLPAAAAAQYRLLAAGTGILCQLMMAGVIKCPYQLLGAGVTEYGLVSVASLALTVLLMIYEGSAELYQLLLMVPTSCLPTRSLDLVAAKMALQLPAAERTELTSSLQQQGMILTMCQVNGQSVLDATQSSRRR